MKLNHLEKEIIKSLSEGDSQKELAGKYNISATNINNFLRRARVKTGMRSTIQLVCEAKIKKIV